MHTPTGSPSDVPAPAGERLFDVAPPDELLYSLTADGSRRYMQPVVRKGHYWRIRRNIAAALVLLFFALPWIPIAGHPAVFFDLATRRFHLFGTTFHPTDNLLLAAFGFGVIVTVFFVGSTFGRMWCGFACPQTVYLEFLFRPIETLIEGGPTRQRTLNKGPWTLRKLAIKAAKWSVWAALAVAMAVTFVAYFTGWRALVDGLATNPAAWTGALFVVGALTTLILFDFGWFRDQMCTIACPYGRLQNVIADQDTILVAYDERHGEPRLPPKRRLPGIDAGECLDCGACVTACPTGTDIRRGLQVECIGTGQCVDACDEVMRKRGKARGLIQFTSQREQSGGRRRIWRPRNLVYLGLMTVAWSTLAVLIATRDDALIEVVRGGREPYRLLGSGEVANQQRMRFTNQLDEPQHFDVRVVSPDTATLVLSESPVVVAPEQVTTINAVTTVPRAVYRDGQVRVRYLVTSDKGFRKEVDFILLGPFSASGSTR